jgi:hypothetical protein
MSTPCLVKSWQPPASLSETSCSEAIRELERENRRLREMLAFYELNLFHTRPDEPDHPGRAAA